MHLPTVYKDCDNLHYTGLLMQSFQERCHSHFAGERITTLFITARLLLTSAPWPAMTAPVETLLSTCLSNPCNFCRAMLCISAAIAVMRCPSVSLSVRPSVTFVGHVKTNKYIFKNFSPSGSHTILFFFRTKRGGDIPTGTP